MIENSIMIPFFSSDLCWFRVCVIFVSNILEFSIKSYNIIMITIKKIIFNITYQTTCKNKEAQLNQSYLLSHLTAKNIF